MLVNVQEARIARSAKTVANVSIVKVAGNVVCAVKSRYLVLVCQIRFFDTFVFRPVKR